jgi:hypothetical protein
MLNNFTLSQLRELEGDVPGLGSFPSRLLADNYDDFIEVLYKDIDEIILLKEENPEFYQSDKSEDRLTVEIKNSLVHMGYDASHDEKVGGHADLVVRKKPYLWIGEAKIHSDYEYLWQGFQQLTTRYSTGDCNQKDGGLLIYIFGKNAKSVMKKWQIHLADKNLEECSCVPCPKRSLAFFSSHVHDCSGEMFRVRHMPIALYFSPQDKSGLNRKNRSTNQSKLS